MSAAGKTRECPQCHGVGHVLPDGSAERIACPECNGDGKVPVEDPPCPACGAVEYDALCNPCEDCGKAGCTACLWPPGVDWMWNAPTCCEAGAERWERDFAAAREKRAERPASEE